jgi:superfamily I DNA/RNA helicase
LKIQELLKLGKFLWNNICLTPVSAFLCSETKGITEQLDGTAIRDKPERMKRLRQDPYYNALQIKYAYAVTCHKAQGGQWQHVYIDQGYITEDMLSPDYFRWLYTALTRATEKVFLVNWPKEQVESCKV